MISVPGTPGVAFGTASDGDGRSDVDVRARISRELGIAGAWATVDQTHGTFVARVHRPGHAGEADALITRAIGLPLAIATADCVPVALIGDREVAIVHAGWRGVASGIVWAAMSAFADSDVRTAVIGPHIGTCCYEVGQDVIDALGGHDATTTWGTRSGDLAGAIRSQIADRVTVKAIGGCTMCTDDFVSFRRNRSVERQVSLVWR